jgi:hypothetical protein
MEVQKRSTASKFFHTNSGIAGSLSSIDLAMEGQWGLANCNCQQPVPKVLGPAIWEQVFLDFLCVTLIQKIEIPLRLPSIGSIIFTFVLHSCQKNV